MAGRWEYRKWAVAEEGCGPTFYTSRDAAEKYALGEARGSPGYRLAIYEAVATVEAKVAAPKVRQWK